MLENFLSQVRDNVSKKIEQSIGNSNFIEKVMSYTALSKSKMIRAGLIFASAENNKNLFIIFSIKAEQTVVTQNYANIVCSN